LHEVYWIDIGYHAYVIRFSGDIFICNQQLLFIFRFTYGNNWLG